MADEKVIVTKTKLDALAVSISEKSGASLPLTIAQMKAAVDGIFTGNVTQDADGYLVLDKDGTGSGKLMYSLDDYISGTEPVGDIRTNVTHIKDYRFYNDANITSISAPNVTTCGEYAFCKCSNLVNISFPELTYLNQRTFAECSKLASCIFPKVTGTGQGVFYNTVAKAVVLPALTLAGINIFSTFKGEIIDFGKNCSGFSGWVFNGMNNTFPIHTIIIRRISGVPTLDGMNGWAGCGQFASGGSGGTLYVPSALISSYQSANNWSTFLAQNSNNQILPIEGSIYETQYADGTAINN